MNGCVLNRHLLFYTRVQMFFFCFQILDKTCTSFQMLFNHTGRRTCTFSKSTTTTFCKVYVNPKSELGSESVTVTKCLIVGPMDLEECNTHQYVEQLITGSKKPPGTKLMLGYYYNILPMAFCNISGCKHSPDNR